MWFDVFECWDCFGFNIYSLRLNALVRFAREDDQVCLAWGELEVQISMDLHLMD